MDKLSYLKDRLKLASELEHQLMAAYLFTAFTTKQGTSEGISFPQAGLTNAWRGMITGVAVQEMLHLGLVSNMLTAIGGTPHFSRQNFPLTYKDMERFGYRDGDQAKLGLWKLDECSISRFVWFESYDGGVFPYCDDEEVPYIPLKPEPADAFLSLESLGLSTLVELYESIAILFKELSEQMGSALFKVPSELQITDREMTALFNYPPAVKCGDNLPLLNAVTDLKSAITAIDTIIVQGEGDFTSWRAFLESEFPKDDPKYKDFWPFPTIQSPSHESTFKNILKQVPGSKSWNPSRNVVNNPLPERITNEFTKKAALLFNEVYRVMLDVLGASFAHDGSQYAVASLTQSALRVMIYVMSPLGNMLTQLRIDPDTSQIDFQDAPKAGPSFIYLPEQDNSWQFLEKRLRKIAAEAKSLVAEAPDRKVWLTPNYLGIPPQVPKSNESEYYPQETIKKLLSDMVALNLDFLADRIRDVTESMLPELHVCMGLNACKGQDVTRTAWIAGSGDCSTANPHICSAQNSCKGQGGCGFTPDPSTQPDLQDHPGENACQGQGACGSPILPSTNNTHGKNTPIQGEGDPVIFAKGKGSVWRFARILFEKKMKEQNKAYGPSKGPGGVGGNDFPGWEPPIASGGRKPIQADEA